MTKLIENLPDKPIARLIFAHGAGAGMEHPFMQQMAELLCQQHLAITRFEFPYMVKTRDDGKKRPPDRLPMLLDSMREIISASSSSLPLFIAGKSMGGRIASLVADECSLAGLICLGFPFHAPGKPEKLKSEHLISIKTPTLILQGERDTFGNKQEIETYSFSSSVEVQYLTDGDHSFKPRKASGVDYSENLEFAADCVANFVNENL